MSEHTIKTQHLSEFIVEIKHSSVNIKLTQTGPETVLIELSIAYKINISRFIFIKIHIVLICCVGVVYSDY
jgi:hypothetical protein